MAVAWGIYKTSRQFAGFGSVSVLSGPAQRNGGDPHNGITAVLHDQWFTCC